MLTELASYPQDQCSTIAGFVSGANKVLCHVATDGDNPTKIEVEFRTSGNVHIWLVTGRWRQDGDKVLEVYEQLPWE